MERTSGSSMLCRSFSPLGWKACPTVPLIFRPAFFKARSCFHPLPPRLEVREIVRNRKACPFEICQRRDERDIAQTELIGKEVASLEFALEVGKVCSSLAFAFGDFVTIALIFRLAHLPKNFEQRRHQIRICIILEGARTCASDRITR